MQIVVMFEEHNKWLQGRICNEQFQDAKTKEISYDYMKKTGVAYLISKIR